jgi:hypothetical protein
MEDKMHTIIANLKIQGKYYPEMIISYFVIIALCSFYLLVFSPVKGFATDYYVDNVDGDDNNNGTEEYPWNTLRKVYLMSSPSSSPHIQAGDTIYLKRGGIWKGAAWGANNVTAALALQCSGTDTQYITIQAYGTGDKPIIYGNGLSCAIYLDNDFIKLSNIAVTYTYITPIISLLLDDTSGTSRVSIDSATSIPLTPSVIPPPPRHSPRPRFLRPNHSHPSAPPFPTPDEIFLALRRNLSLLSFASSPPAIPPAPLHPHFALTPFSCSPAASLPTPDKIRLRNLNSTPPATALSPTDITFPPDYTAPARVNGKGIRIQGGNEGNIIIDSCDVYNCPMSGISIGNRGNVEITGGEAQDSQIVGNQQNGIEVFDNLGNNNPININNCKIYGNNWNGIYLEGNYATIFSNNIYNNANSPAPNEDKLHPTHNIYLWGDHGTVYGNTIQGAVIGCGFRYSGSGLKFGFDSQGFQGPNNVEGNYGSGIGLCSNDSINNCDNNEIAYNNISVMNTDRPNNMGIGIDYNISYTIFTNTSIHNNKITGNADDSHKTGGIDVKPCQGLNIHHNTFCDNSYFKRLSGPLIQIEREYKDPNGNLIWQWPDDPNYQLNSTFSHDNTFYSNSPDSGVGQFWFYDKKFNNDQDYMTWDSWISLIRDAGYELKQGNVPPEN